MFQIIHVVPHFKPGGAERVAVHMIRGFDRDRFQLSALSLGPPCGSDLERMLEECGVRVWFLGKGPGFDPRMFTRVRRVLAACKPDVIHTHVHVLRYTLPYTLLHPAPVMLHTVHNVAEQEVEPRARWLQKFAFTKAGIIPVAVASEVAASLTRMYGLRDTRVIPNCIPVGTYSRPQIGRLEWRLKEGFAPDDLLFVCVARFEVQKNHAMLIRAFGRGPAAHPNARLLLVGRGVLRDEIERMALGMGLADKVRFLGLRTDVPDVLGASDVFVLSSDFEGNPLAALEAMAAGLPVVGTCAGGLPEIVQTGVEGCIVPTGDEQALANALCTLLDSPEARLRMGRAAAFRARKEFDTPVMVRAYSDLYDRLLTQAGLFRELSSAISPRSNREFSGEQTS